MNKDNLTLLTKRLLGKNHLVHASLPEQMVADIVFASNSKFRALRFLSRIERFSETNGTGIVYEYQKNECF